MNRASSLLAIVCVLICFVSPICAQSLPGTQPLTIEGDLAEQMVAGIDKFLLREIEASVAGRRATWKPDYSSPEKYTASLAPQRELLARIIGAVDERASDTRPDWITTVGESGALLEINRDSKMGSIVVQWHVARGLFGEGLMVEPVPAHSSQVKATVIALTDADQTPEMLVGYLPGVKAEERFVRRLALSGCEVIVPAIIDRSDKHSATRTRKTNQPHREFVYRPAFELGRHIMGYEVQEVLAIVDWLSQDPHRRHRPIGVIGYGEGGLIALCAGAIDPRIKSVAVCGHFQPREKVWQEPIYRNVFGLLSQFGDAELASMIAPRALIVEACRGPEIAGPPAPSAGRTGAAPGELKTPAVVEVRAEFDRVRGLIQSLKPEPQWKLMVSGDGAGPFATTETLEHFLHALAPEAKLAAPQRGEAVAPEKFDPDYPAARQKRLFTQLVEDTQDLLRDSETARDMFWSKADRASRSVEKWQESTKWYRDYFYNDVIGRFDRPLLKPNPRSRRIYDEPKFTGYEVMLDVFPDVFAYGILLLPKDIKPSEKRPVVVCQHGLEGRPTDCANPTLDHPAYHKFACRLAEEGFITFAPQNPYIFKDKFRTLQRKANPLGKTLFSIIVPQHQQIVNWLSALPEVDPQRIGFYGLSYGGKTAMRVPALVEGYCLSICSADFNEWIDKNASTRAPYTYVHTGEYEIFEWNLGNTFNYAEMAGLIAPRPFMVERGHRDGVGTDPRVSYEYAKVRLLYADLKIPERTTIEYFDGPHTINGVGTFEFLRKHLRWPGGVP